MPSGARRHLYHYMLTSSWLYAIFTADDDFYTTTRIRITAAKSAHFDTYHDGHFKASTPVQQTF